MAMIGDFSTRWPEFMCQFSSTAGPKFLSKEVLYICWSNIGRVWRKYKILWPCTKVQAGESCTIIEVEESHLYLPCQNAWYKAIGFCTERLGREKKTNGQIFRDDLIHYWLGIICLTHQSQIVKRIVKMSVKALN